jgi:putative ABC transport system ATP-binding protein
MSILEIKEVRKTYGYDENKVDALSHVTLSIEEGSFVAIVGKSGSGKSTLLHVMGGLTRPQQGQVLLEGKALYEMSDDQLSRYRRRRMGFVFQFYNLISSLNVIENIILPIHLDHLKEDEEYIQELLVLLGIEDKKTAFVKELSGGQQQRVAIARALAMKPALILADEPTGNLDAKSSQEVVSLLKLSQRKYKQTLILVTHDDMIASQADRIITIEDGRIVGDTDEK